MDVNCVTEAWGAAKVGKRPIGSRDKLAQVVLGPYPWPRLLQPNIDFFQVEIYCRCSSEKHFLSCVNAFGQDFEEFRHWEAFQRYDPRGLETKVNSTTYFPANNLCPS